MLISMVLVERFVIDEDVDTNDDNCKVNGHKSTTGQRDRDVRYTTMSANVTCYNYLGNGGKLSAMN